MLIYRPIAKMDDITSPEKRSSFIDSNLIKLWKQVLTHRTGADFLLLLLFPLLSNTKLI